MGHNSTTGTRSHIPSCCHWWWSCCCCHCSGSFYVDNVVVSEASNSVPDVANLLEFKPQAEDNANPNIYGNHLDKEALLNTGNNVNADYLEKEPKPYQENYDYRSYREEYNTDSELERDRDCDRDSYLERMSGSHTDSYEGRAQGYLGTYHRIRHMSGLSEGQPYPSNYSMGPYPQGAYRSGDSYSGSYGSPDHSGVYPPNPGGEEYGSRYSQEGIGMTTIQALDPEQSSYEMQTTLQRNDVKQVSGILKRTSGHEVSVDTNDEEESAYNEHFKNSSHAVSGPGEYRVPSVRVRPVQALYTAQHQDFAGTATQQGKQDGNGKKSPFLEREVILPRELSATWDTPDQGEQQQQQQPGPGPEPASVERLDRIQLEMNPPVDRWNLMYLTLILHGVGTLMPWNIFINAKTVSYQAQPRGDWQFLLPDYFVHYKLGVEYTNVESSFVPFFLQYLALSAQLPNVLFNWINVFFQLSGNLTPRIVWTMLLEILVLIVTIVLAMVETSTWPSVFFYLTIGSVVLLNMANGVYQNTVYGLAARLPFRYTGAVVLGSNLSGTIVALINVLCISISPNPRTAAIYYFITALFMLLACFDTYFALPLNRFYRYHEHLYQKSIAENQKSVIYVISYWNIFKKCFPQLLNIFLIFAVTLSVFPAVLSDIDRVYSSFFISKEYFISLTCFLTFNACAVLGNMMPSYFTWPSPQRLFVPVVARLLFIPFFLLCNYRPSGVERLWPVLFHWDGLYWFGAVLFALSGGYTASLALMYCPRSVEAEFASVAGMMGASAIGTGILAGIAFSCTMPLIVSNPSIDWELPTFWPAYHPD